MCCDRSLDRSLGRSFDRSLVRDEFATRFDVAVVRDGTTYRSASRFVTRDDEFSLEDRDAARRVASGSTRERRRYPSERTLPVSPRDSTTKTFLRRYRWRPRRSSSTICDSTLSRGRSPLVVDDRTSLDETSATARGAATLARRIASRSFATCIHLNKS